jgi:hypothetical protein
VAGVGVAGSGVGFLRFLASFRGGRSRDWRGLKGRGFCCIWGDFGGVDRGQEVVVGGGGSWDRDGVPWLGWLEVAIFGGSVLVSGRAGGRSGGPMLLISVRWTQKSVVRKAAAS